MRLLLSPGIFVLLIASAQAQLQRPFVSASGEGVVPIKPDLLRINVGVTTQAAAAQDASDRNSAIANAVLTEMRNLLGATADIKTAVYSVAPDYTYPQIGAPVLKGYTATNIFQVSTLDLTIGGRLIDTAAKAGANSIQGLTFMLKDPDPAKQQALNLATQQARAHAAAMAAGLGKGVGDVISVTESSVSTPSVLELPTANVIPATRVASFLLGPISPVDSGNLVVRASVVLQVALQ
jgi:uncharacterized protein YggE